MRDVQGFRVYFAVYTLSLHSLMHTCIFTKTSANMHPCIGRQHTHILLPTHPHTLANTPTYRLWIVLIVAPLLRLLMVLLQAQQQRGRVHKRVPRYGYAWMGG